MPQKMTFERVGPKEKPLIADWLHRDHVKPYFYGEGLANTLRSLSDFVELGEDRGPISFDHWIAYLEEEPFGYLMTSKLVGPYNPECPYAKWFDKEIPTITLDLLIGEESFLGRGLAAPMIRNFLLDKCAQASRVMIDPEEENLRAVHTYEKAGFRKIELFPQEHDEPKLCWMMHLETKTLKANL